MSIKNHPFLGCMLNLGRVTIQFLSIFPSSPDNQVTLSSRIPCTTDPASRCVGMEAVEIQGHVHVHQIAVFQGSQILKTELGVSKNRGKTPNMDGL